MWRRLELAFHPLLGARVMIDSACVWNAKGVLLVLVHLLSHLIAFLSLAPSIAPPFKSSIIIIIIIKSNSYIQAHGRVHVKAVCGAEAAAAEMHGVCDCSLRPQGSTSSSSIITSSKDRFRPSCLLSVLRVLCQSAPWGVFQQTVDSRSQARYTKMQWMREASGSCHMSKTRVCRSLRQVVLPLFRV